MPFSSGTCCQLMYAGWHGRQACCSSRWAQQENQDQASDAERFVRQHRHQQPRPPLQNQGLNQTSWSPSTSQSTFPLGYPAVVPAYPLQVYPGSGALPSQQDPSLQGFWGSQCRQDRRCCPPIQPCPYPAPLVTPMVAKLHVPSVGKRPSTPATHLPASHSPFPNQRLSQARDRKSVV